MTTRKAPPPQLLALAEGLRGGILSARRKMVPPNIASLDFVGDLWGFAIAYAVADLALLDELEAGPRTAAEVAASVGLDPDRVYRLLRAATQVDLVEEGEARRFTLLPVGRSLCKDAGGFRDFLIFMGRYGLSNWARLPDAVREGKTSIELQHGMAPFEWFTTEPGAAEAFNRGMTAVSNVAIDAVLGVYSFAGFARIVDVGGGHGRLLGGILDAAPAARGVLFDLPSVVAGAGPILEKLGVAGRCEVVGGSFFESVPSEGDLYVMKAIIHDWDDDDALKILASIRRGIRPSGRLLLIETVVPEPGKKHFSKLLDIEMIVHAGGRERTHDEYAALLRRAGFRLDRIVPTASPISIVEASPG